MILEVFEGEGGGNVEVSGYSFLSSFVWLEVIIEANML
jgi:hypothetical protein